MGDWEQLCGWYCCTRCTESAPREALCAPSFQARAVLFTGVRCAAACDRGAATEQSTVARLQTDVAGCTTVVCAVVHRGWLSRGRTSAGCRLKYGAATATGSIQSLCPLLLAGKAGLLLCNQATLDPTASSLALKRSCGTA